MSYLLDTHALVWSLVTPEKLSVKMRRLLGQSGIEAYVSVVSFWEISIKYFMRYLSLT